MPSSRPEAPGTDQVRTSYDLLPYRSQATAEASPNRMAAMGTLLGLSPRPVAACRVLEIGCAEGGNALPIAVALPGARVVGIDLSERQVAIGRERIRALGLPNVELICADFSELPEGLGAFDYVIAHGLYSWVPEPLQQVLLDTFRRVLAPGGLAYVSFNTFPGWNYRSVLRQVALFRARAESDPRKKVAAAREFLKSVTEASREHDDLFHAILARELDDFILPAPDEYVFHEYLEPESHPCWFHEFSAKVEASSLAYLCDARLGASPAPALRGPLGEALRAFAPGRIDREQCFDFVVNRAFRQSLLCHRDSLAGEAVIPARADRLFISSHCRPSAEPVEMAAGAAADFVTPRGGRLSTDDPLLKRALLHLWERYPRPVVLSELLALAAPGEEPTREGEERLRLALLKAYSSDFVDLLEHAPGFVAEPGERPVASPLARLQAGIDGSEITTLLHRNLAMEDGLARVVLALCDGTRDREALSRDAVLEILSGGFMNENGRTVTDAATVRRAVEGDFARVLDLLAKSALFTA